MTKRYNYIFSSLVEDENDLIGLIAYGLYKQHKVEYIRSYEEKHEGEAPGEPDFENFALSSCSPSALKGYRDEAESLLQKLTLTSAREELDEYEREMLRNYRSEIERVVKEQKPSMWTSVWSSIIGAAVFSVFVAIGTFLGKTSEQDTVDLITKTVNHTMELANKTEAAQSDSIYVEADVVNR